MTNKVKTPSKYTVQILVVLMLVVVCFWGFSAVTDDNDDIVRASNNAVIIGCRADKANAKILRGILDSQIEFVKRSQEPPPPTIEQRVKALVKQRNSIVVPNCGQRVKELSELKD